MKRRAFAKQKLKTFITGVLPVVLTAVIFILFFLMADMKAKEDNGQRAADIAGNAALNLEWMLEDGVEKICRTADLISRRDADIETFFASIKGDFDSDSIAIVRNGIIHYANGDTFEDVGAEKYANCEINGRLVRISGVPDGIQLRMSVDNHTDMICVFDAARIRNAVCGVFKGECYYAIYNIRTGSYVYDILPFEGADYYDALMGINIKGDGEALFGAYNAQAHIRSLFGSEDGLIAQRRTNISPWGVAFVLPESAFDNSGSSMEYLFIVIGVVILIQLALSVMFLIYVFRRTGNLKRTIAEISDSAHRKLELSVEYTGVCVFEYNRNIGAITDFHDGMADACHEGGLHPNSIDEFIAYYKPNDDDALHLYDIFTEIKAGESANADVHAFANEGERLLRFRLQCLEVGDVIVGTVRDCTQDELAEIRIKDEEKFLELMRPKAASIWDIRVQRNQLRLIYDKRGHTEKRFGIKKDVWMAYEDAYPDRYREHLHPADADQFTSIMTLESMMNMYRTGKSECVQDCRVRSLKKTGYEWHRQMLRVFKDTDSNEIVARLYMLNVDAEKNAEMERRERYRIHQQTLTAIGGIYYGLYYIELDNDLCYTAKSHAGELCSDICAPFKTAFAEYIEKYVHEDDRETLRRLIDPYMLRKQVQEDQRFHRCEFRRRVGEHYEWSAAIIQAARFENAQIRDVVLAFEDISDIRASENA